MNKEFDAALDALLDTVSNPDEGDYDRAIVELRVFVAELRRDRDDWQTEARELRRAYRALRREVRELESQLYSVDVDGFTEFELRHFGWQRPRRGAE